MSGKNGAVPASVVSYIPIAVSCARAQAAASLCLFQSNYEKLAHLMGRASWPCLLCMRSRLRMARAHQCIVARRQRGVSVRHSR